MYCGFRLQIVDAFRHRVAINDSEVKFMTFHINHVTKNITSCCSNKNIPDLVCEILQFVLICISNIIIITYVLKTSFVGQPIIYTRESNIKTLYSFKK